MEMEMEFDATLAIIRKHVFHEGNYGNAYPDEYARYALNHNLDPAGVATWAHLVQPQPDPVGDSHDGREPVIPSKEGVERLAVTLMQHTGADPGEAGTMAGYIEDATWIASQFPHLLNAQERWQSHR